MMSIFLTFVAKLTIIVLFFLILFRIATILSKKRTDVENLFISKRLQKNIDFHNSVKNDGSTTSQQLDSTNVKIIRISSLNSIAKHDLNIDLDEDRCSWTFPPDPMAIHDLPYPTDINSIFTENGSLKL